MNSLKFYKLNINFFSFKPRIKFIGKRSNFKDHDLNSNHNSKQEIKNSFLLSDNNITLNSTNKSSNTDNKHINNINKKYYGKAYSAFIKNFNNVNSDYDIPRAEIAEEEIDAINNANFKEYNNNDWKKIKYNL